MLERSQRPRDEVELLAPTLMRSEVLEALYRAVQAGDLEEAVALDRLSTFAATKIRYLGDKVLRRQAWKVAASLGWSSTRQAEYVALTQLQAHALVTLDDRLREEASELVRFAGHDEVLVDAGG